jgi:hypothetical protein
VRTLHAVMEFEQFHNGMTIKEIVGFVKTIDYAQKLN